MRNRRPPSTVSTDWEKLLAHMERGTILVTGGPGHGELARYLLSQLDRALPCVALVDAGLDRPAVGVPTCLGLALTRPWRAPAALWFVGDLDPRRRPLPAVVGASHLVAEARRQGARAVIVDGGPAMRNGSEASAGKDLAGNDGRELQLHLALAAGVDQVVALQGNGHRNGALAGLARALDTAGRSVHRVASAPELHPPSAEEAEAYRQRRFAAHFRDARTHRFGFDKVLRRDVVLGAGTNGGGSNGAGSTDAGSNGSTAGETRSPGRKLTPGRLVGLIAEDSTCLALGVLEEVARDHLAVFTPCERREAVHRIEVGSLELDPSTWPGHEEERPR